MPLDGLTLGFAAREIHARIAGGRIDRITQPEKDAIVLLVRAEGINYKLLLCASPNNARLHFTNQTFSNPLEPPMFCMLLRKQLMSGRILAVKQIAGDRVIHIDIDAVDELGDYVLRRLILEIMHLHLQVASQAPAGPGNLHLTSFVNHFSSCNPCLHLEICLLDYFFGKLWMLICSVP